MPPTSQSAAHTVRAAIARYSIPAAIVLLVVLPLVLQRGADPPPADARELIVITPHNEQIRFEFAAAFDAWHQREFGERVHVVYNVPGGTSEIVKMLEAQFAAALVEGRSVGGSADLVFGGGSYEHGRLKRGVTVEVDGAERAVPISAPAGFDEAWLDEIYGVNRIGDAPLYDAEQYWYGLALSGFGIVYNRDLLAELDLPEPRSWSDLGHPRLRGWVALVNPAQSGSITTAFEAVLQRRGWTEGWRIIRRAAANSRYFSASSLKPPIDVSRGDAAMGICIDFYGRYQSEALESAGSPGRVGYVDPAGETTIDPDPISLLAGAPHPELARRFVRFCLSPEGQALWQFPAGGPADEMGPRRFELRRMPIRRSMYEQHMERFVDQVNPFEIARPLEGEQPPVRPFIAPLFSAMAMESHDPLSAAWSAIVDHPAYPDGGGVVTANDVNDPQLRRMLELFDELPDVPGPDGATYSLERTDDLPAIADGWLDDEWTERGLWSRHERGRAALRRMLADAFRERYARILEIAAERPAHMAAGGAP